MGKLGLVAVCLAVLLAAVLGAALFPVLKDTVGGSSVFCSVAGDWRSTFETYLIRANSDGSREGEALGETSETFKPSLLIVLPEGEGADERKLRALMQDATRGTEQWLSDLQLRDALTTGIGDSVSDLVRATNFELAVEAFQKSETQRVNGNATLREVSYQLGRVCGLDPLPIYSSQGQGS